MEQKLKNIVVRIQTSALSHEVKADLYIALQEGLRSVALPILLKHMPGEKLHELAAHPENVTVDTYIDLLSQTVTNEIVLKEIDTALTEVLTTVEARLKKHGV